MASCALPVAIVVHHLQALGAKPLGPSGRRSRRGQRVAVAEPPGDYLRAVAERHGGHAEQVDPRHRAHPVHQLARGLDREHVVEVERRRGHPGHGRQHERVARHERRHLARNGSPLHLRRHVVGHAVAALQHAEHRLGVLQAGLAELVAQRGHAEAHDLGADDLAAQVGRDALVHAVAGRAQRVGGLPDGGLDVRVHHGPRLADHERDGRGPSGRRERLDRDGRRVGGVGPGQHAEHQLQVVDRPRERPGRAHQVVRRHRI